jgi:hypothetical protein
VIAAAGVPLVIARLLVPTGSALFSATEPAVGWAKTFAVRTVTGVAPAIERLRVAGRTVTRKAGGGAVSASEPVLG